MGTKHFEVERFLTDVDADTGEVRNIVRHERHVTRSVEGEPHFIKVYLNDIARLNGIQAKAIQVLFELLSMMDYRNQISLSAGKKKEMCEKLDIWSRRSNGATELGVNILDQQIHRLVKGGFLSRKDKGVYVANPDLFGRGRWGDIRKIRLSIEYTEDGRFLITDVKNKK